VVESTDDAFTDPCPDIYKLTRVGFKCIKGEALILLQQQKQIIIQTKLPLTPLPS